MGSASKNKYILLVDPDPEFCRAAGTALSDAGYDAVTTQDVDDALARLENTRFDLIITELGSDGPGGVELYLSAIKRHPGLSKSDFLFTCGNETRLYALSCSSLSYMKKPLSTKALVQRVDKLLAPPPRTPALRTGSERRAIERFEWIEDCNIYEPGGRVPKASAVTLDVSEDGVKIRLAGRALKPDTTVDVQTSSIYIKAKARVVWSAEAGENRSVAGLKLSSRLPNAPLMSSLAKKRRP